MMKQKFVVASCLPHAGFGNMLLVWARAVLFAELNSLPMLAPNWNKLYIGPWLRGERIKRYYGSYFSDSNYQSRLTYGIEKILNQRHIHCNLNISKLDLTSSEFDSPGQHEFLFDKMPPWNDYFQDLKNYQPIVKQKLYADIYPHLLQKILIKPSPQIGVHIRRGDYQVSANSNIFTSLEWYIGTINSIRDTVKADIPVTVFSDGYPEELAQIIALPNVSLSPETSALSDLITMSRSKLLVASAHSSFSAWASYLGQSPTLWSSERAHLYQPIFTNETKKSIYEGGFNPDQGSVPELLKFNLMKLDSE
jgi:Glycosyl transferase family 11